MDGSKLKTFDSLIANYAALGRQFSLFTLIGAFGTLAQYVLLVILVESVGIDAVTSSAAGALLGAIINYVLNYRFTFKSRTRHRIALPRFLAVATVGLLINTSLMWVAVDLTNLHYILGQLVTSSFVLLWNFIGNRYWTFEEDSGNSTRWGV